MAIKQQKKQIKDENEEVVFTNYTDEDFEGRWNFSVNHKVWPIKSGKSYFLPYYLAWHFANALVDRELNKQKLPTNHFSRQSLLDKCVELIPEEPQQINTVRMKEVPHKEVVLNRDLRAERLQEAYNLTPSEVQFNRKAVQQLHQEEKKEEFEPPKEEVPATPTATSAV